MIFGVGSYKADPSWSNKMNHVVIGRKNFGPQAVTVEMSLDV